MMTDDTNEQGPLFSLTTAFPQTLGDCTYTIDPSRVDRIRGGGPAASASSSVRWIFRRAATIVLAPVVLAVGTVATALVFLSPTIIKHRIVSWIIPKCCSKLDQLLEPERRELLRNCQGRVLDVGSGGGAYLRYLNKSSTSSAQVTDIVALEPVRALHSSIRRQAEIHGIPVEKLTILPMGAEEYLEYHRKQQQQGDRSLERFDWIIFGNVLCEIRYRHSMLRAVDELLRDNGYIYFCEHVGCPPGTWRRRIQDWINPFWRTLSCGCNCNHDSLLDIQRTAPEWRVISWTFHNFRIGLGPLVMGLVHKVKVPQ